MNVCVCVIRVTPLTPSPPLPSSPSLTPSLTQIKPVVPVHLSPEPVHVRVPLGVRVPQHFGLHDLLSLRLCVFRHVSDSHTHTHTNTLPE